MEDQRWKLWSTKEANNGNMIIKKHPLLYSADLDEFMNFLPSLNGASVLELGSGVGRFTGELARRARHVTAVELAPQFVDECRTRLGHLGNLTLVCGDFLKVELPMEKFDVVVSMWMYSQVSQCEALMMTTRVQQWLKPGGLFIFREDGPQTYAAKHKHPGHYRSPAVYEKLLGEVSTDGYCLAINRCRNNRAYIMIIDAFSQVDFVAQKLPTVFHLSCPSTTAKVLPSLPLPTLHGQDFKAAGVDLGSNVLVVGCGTGDVVIHLATTYNACVVGLDSSITDFTKAIQRQTQLEPRIAKLIQFEMRAPEDAEYNACSFDVILVRESVLSTPQHYRRLPTLKSWLTPSGKMFIHDLNISLDDDNNLEVEDCLVFGYKDDKDKEGCYIE